MKRNQKNTLLTMAFASALVFAVGGVYAKSYDASADVVTDSKIAVVNSASLRIEDFGVRFKTTVDKTYAADVTEVHTLMIPTVLLDGAELTAETNDVMDSTLADKKYEIGNNYYYNSVLTDIPVADYGTEVSVRAYVVKDGQKVYSENTVSTSVAYLANAALENNYQAYANDLTQYLVKGITLSETEILVNAGDTVEIGSIAYFDEASAGVIAKLNEKYSLRYESANPQVVNVVEGTAKAVGRGTTTVTVTLTDGDNDLFEKTYTVNVAQPQWGQVFDFGYPSLNNVSLESTVPSESLGERTFGSDANGDYVQIKMPNREYVNTRFHNIKLEDYKAFDKITIRFAGYYIKENGEQKAASINTSIYNYEGNAYTKAVALLGDDTLKTYSVDRSEAKFDAVLTDPSNYGYFRITMSNWGGYFSDGKTLNTMVVRFYGVDFTYADIALDNEDNTSVNLTQKFGLTASELQNVKFNGVEVADITNFTATQNGTLTFDVNKFGYAPTSMSVGVKYTELKDPTRIVFDDVSKFTSVSAMFNTTTFPINQVTDGGYKAWQIEYTGAYPWLRLADESLKRIADFDYFTIRYKIAYSISSGSFGIQGTTGNVYNSADTTKTDDGWTLATWIKNGKRPQVFEYIKANGKFEISMYTWNASATCTLTIAEIVCGYDDITSDGATAINLTSKFNATADEITATFTPTGGTATEITSETAWTPTQNGVLNVTVKKAGYKAVTYTLKVTVSTGA